MKATSTLQFGAHRWGEDISDHCEVGRLAQVARTRINNLGKVVWVLKQVGRFWCIRSTSRAKSLRFIQRVVVAGARTWGCDARWTASVRDSAIQGSERTCDAVPGKMFGIYLVKTSAIYCVVYWFKGRLKGSNKWKPLRKGVESDKKSLSWNRENLKFCRRRWKPLNSLWKISGS